MANINRTNGSALLDDDDVLELLDWHPELSTWCQEYLNAHDRPPAGGWRWPSSEWIDWARDVLCQVPIHMDGLDAIAGILTVGEMLHPQGMERQRLQDALLALGRLRGQDYQPADSRVDMAEKNGVIRTERVDLWRPGMASGTGWRTFCRLTLYGRAMVQTGDMPEAFPAPQAEPSFSAPANAASTTWFDRVHKSLAATPAPAQLEPTEASRTSCTIANCRLVDS